MSELLFSTAYENKFVEKLLLGHAYVLAHKHALRLFLFIFPFNSVIHIRLVLLLRDVYALAHKHPLGFFFLTLFFRSIICIRFAASFCWKLFVRWRTNIFQNYFRVLCSLDLSFAYGLLHFSAGGCLCVGTQTFFRNFFVFCLSYYIQFRLHIIFSSLHFICLAVGLCLCIGAQPLFMFFFSFFYVYQCF